MVLVERDGQASPEPIDRANADTLKAAVRETVAEASTPLTDERSPPDSPAGPSTGGGGRPPGRSRGPRGR
jgi:hypothetical protein